MATVRMYSTGVCPYCVMAEKLLAAKGVAIEKIRIDLDTEKRGEMMQLTGRRSVPQIFVGETHVGGYDDLAALDQAGKLAELLRSCSRAIPFGKHMSEALQPIFDIEKIYLKDLSVEVPNAPEVAVLAIFAC